MKNWSWLIFLIHSQLKVFIKGCLFYLQNNFLLNLEAVNYTVNKATYLILFLGRREKNYPQGNLFYILFKNLWNDLEDLFYKILPMSEAINSQSKMNQRNTLPKTSPLLPDPFKPAGSPQRGQTSLQYRRPISHTKRIERTMREIKWAQKTVLRPLKGEKGVIHPRLPF